MEKVLNCYNEVREKNGERWMVKVKRFTATRGGKNTVLTRVRFNKPIKCSVDGYLKDTCLCRGGLGEDNGCACVKDQLVNISHEAPSGAHVVIHPAPIGIERRLIKAELFKAKKQIRESLRANQRQVRYAKRRRKR